MQLNSLTYILALAILYTRGYYCILHCLVDQIILLNPDLNESSQRLLSILLADRPNFSHLEQDEGENQERMNGAILFPNGPGMIISYGHVASVKKVPKVIHPGYRYYVLQIKANKLIVTSKRHNKWPRDISTQLLAMYTQNVIHEIGMGTYLSLAHLFINPRPTGVFL